MLVIFIQNPKYVVLVTHLGVSAVCLYIMPGTIDHARHGSKQLSTTCTWTYREKQTEKSGSQGTLFLPSGERYCGGWQHNKREGTGTVVYPNKDKYEGDWLNGKRHGVGALWLYDRDRYGIRYTGAWQKDKFHGQGIYYDDSGNAYEGHWVGGLRQGHGQQTYVPEDGDGLTSDVYDGEWDQDNRSGLGIMRYANGDIYEGEWASDMKNGRGKFYYAKGAVYEGTWQEDIAKCGSYTQGAYVQQQEAGALPALQLQDPEQVLMDSQTKLPPIVYY